MVQVKGIDYAHLCVLYTACVIIRGSMIYLSLPVLNLLGHSSAEPVTPADATLMCWGGLRGAVGLALAIQVSIERADGMLSEIQGQRVLFYVGGIALMTLVVNATSCPMLVKFLKLNRPSGTKQMMMLNLKRKMQRSTNTSVGLSSIGAEIQQERLVQEPGGEVPEDRPSDMRRRQSPQRGPGRSAPVTPGRASPPASRLLAVPGPVAPPRPLEHESGQTPPAVM
ncbi:unnamed protein product [Prorocentrum cordatum]|uniref:Cation/H+ exchanger domain-containing protein n=1 Tax=Prorocentrum cordatum TaxID=2364126 RepID=A0ABN9VCM1_9DINO|nr:unnamed protein product [Polarella glacialis]